MTTDQLKQHNINPQQTVSDIALSIIEEFPFIQRSEAYNLASRYNKQFQQFMQQREQDFFTQETATHE